MNDPGHEDQLFLIPVLPVLVIMSWWSPVMMVTKIKPWHSKSSPCSLGLVPCDRLHSVNVILHDGVYGTLDEYGDDVSQNDRMHDEVDTMSLY